jgi:hypothetical protein
MMDVAATEGGETKLMNQRFALPGRGVIQRLAAALVITGSVQLETAAQLKKAVFYGTTHKSTHMAANVVGIAPIGSGSVIWTPNDPNPALNWDLKTVADFKNYDVIVISDSGDGEEVDSMIENPSGKAQSGM